MRLSTYRIGSPGPKNLPRHWLEVPGRTSGWACAGRPSTATGIRLVGQISCLTDSSGRTVLIELPDNYVATRPLHPAADSMRTRQPIRDQLGYGL